MLILLDACWHLLIPWLRTILTDNSAITLYLYLCPHPTPTEGVRHTVFDVDPIGIVVCVTTRILND